MKRTMLAAALLVAAGGASAATLIDNTTLGYYDANIGTVLDGTNGGNTPTGYFPTDEDYSDVHFATAPDLSAAAIALGDWLADPQHLSETWTASPVGIPYNWAPNTEVGVVYAFEASGNAIVSAQFGVDNGIFVWLDGQYLFGARAPYSAPLGEYALSFGQLSAGTHYLQLLLEDHGGDTGYNVLVSDTPVPLPPAIGLFAMGAGLLRMRRRQH